MLEYYFILYEALSRVIIFFLNSTGFKCTMQKVFLPQDNYNSAECIWQKQTQIVTDGRIGRQTVIPMWVFALQATTKLCLPHDNLFHLEVCQSQRQI